MFGPLLEVVVVVGIGRQPAPHRSEVVKNAFVAQQRSGHSTHDRRNRSATQP